ncbi:DMT family transporter [Lutimaribacter sp. EGI FJ00015]|uniref:DMT family transporter n=1 Tax=Lutimaribacter degradans TaxID=2945989 RepID=A0ACC6A001_9RHOB|nr:DMT family transporter [Lutimaribacter sp. EGI FJ00013]MCM2563109.1 DMT family transporter [Lutimaribacter sp. EGI FJ00013]MCO0614288.1 DMT family transporter [Lutimaribacter sp. EGI FJ00015]MCO0637098.1 DMT family transporter [Lutimaribacter sp. EGI FJ00014]
MSDQLKGLTITALGVLMVVPDSLFVRLIEADALVIAFWRNMIAGVLLVVGVLVWQGTRPYRALPGTGIYGVIYAVAVGCAGIMFPLAISLTSVANVVFTLAAMPVFAAIYSRIFLGESISRRMVLTMLAVAVGLSLLAYGSGETEGAHWTGDLTALGVAALFAAGLTAARKVRSVSMVAMVPVGYIGGSLLLWPFIAPLSIPDGQWHFAIFHGVFIAGSSIGLALGPRYIPSAEVGLLILLESVLAPLLAWAVVGEDPGAYALLGGAVVIGALAVSNAVALSRRRA